MAPQSSTTAHLRIGIDTGGTFTDIVCVDATSGAMAVTKVPSTPGNPALGLVSGVHKILREVGATVDELMGSPTGPRLPPTRCCRGRSSHWD